MKFISLIKNLFKKRQSVIASILTPVCYTLPIEDNNLSLEDGLTIIGYSCEKCGNNSFNEPEILSFQFGALGKPLFTATYRCKKCNFPLRSTYMSR